MSIFGFDLLDLSSTARRYLSDSESVQNVRANNESETTPLEGDHDTALTPSSAFAEDGWMPFIDRQAVDDFPTNIEFEDMSQSGITIVSSAPTTVTLDHSTALARSPISNFGMLAQSPHAAAPAAPASIPYSWSMHDPVSACSNWGTSIVPSASSLTLSLHPSSVASSAISLQELPLLSETMSTASRESSHDSATIQSSAATTLEKQEQQQEHWFELIKNEKDWDDLEERASIVLAALDDSMLFTPEEVMLSLLIQQEEELFWKKESTSNTILRRHSRLLGEVAVVLTTAAVSSFGTMMLMRK